MSKAFKLLSGNKLSSVDVSDCEYPSELVQVEGVVSQSGQGGWRGNENYTVHSLSFDAWRVVGEPLRRNPLLLLRPVPIDAEYFGDFPAGTLHKFEVLLSVEQTRAVVSEVVQENIEDNELGEIARELQQPVIVRTERFGDLTLNRQLDWFEGHVDWDDDEVEISFQPEEGLDITNLLETAEVLFRDAAEWQKKIEAFAVAEKLELANDWQEDGNEMDACEFLRRMTLESISILPEGKFEFWHDDGDIFFGHSIQISGSLREGLTDSDIPG
ncbi:hypothetical protein SAMN06265222_106339 [Neorhodopirellula lusitana]|uniref:DUF2262 domain-containing protein n=1 Tax=Neorhodopirellula lusitana TaxID=445327 RepID=A0ABY1Q5R1_9BACT|nr:DUF2262 domain-containing protein [Neorhodopirellula lusitana]SMP60253.1 hypothetical protein SAMN06265222_106339 [Neorhodopirellula lusitana]